ncbi:unnamed protein product [Caenorhabditis nigoni]
MLLLAILFLPLCLAQYGMYGGYGGYGGYGAGYGGYGGYGMPYGGPFMGYGYGGPNPMTMMGGGMYGNGACMDTNPQCSVWASTGQCATNAMVMRQTCALSCGTCASGLGGLGTSSIYSPYGGLGGLDQYPLSQFIGRSIYETVKLTGLLNRQPVPNSSKNIGIITKARAEQLPSR